MSETAYDTYAVAKDLRSVGFAEPQAEALVHAIRRGSAVDISGLAKRSDVDSSFQLLRAELDQKATKLDVQTLRTEIAQARSGVQTWVVGAIGFQTFVIIGAVVGILKLLH